ncbi:unnamed protein product [Linum tenue]|uniref:Uncharacterized protein n=1 Tax=Linum tenue TaxID=586396 RepID=A0AAV0QU40_9ROSI|nr:unnamed protein product [Linum tenue]
MFLGMRLFNHLPSIPVQALNVSSRPTGLSLKPETNISLSSTDGSVLLSFKRTNLTWVTQQDADVVELFIYLGEPCHVCQLLLTVSHGTDDSTSPSTVDVRTGRSLDGLKLVVEEKEGERVRQGGGDALYIGRICRVATTLAFLAQVSHEDKINAAIDLRNIDDDVIDFWNISGIGEYCSGGQCEVRAEKGTSRHFSPALSSAGNEQSIFKCSQCRRKACKVCCAGKGALLLASYNSMDASYNGLESGTSYGSQADSSANHVVPVDGFICKRCCHEIVLHALLLDYVRVLISSRRKNRADNAACQALGQVIGSSYTSSYTDRNHLLNSLLLASFTQYD